MKHVYTYNITKLKIRMNFELKSQNKISERTFVIECHGFGFFCLKPLKTI